MKTEKQKTGALGEDEACRFLETGGHRILARNWRSGHLELDIVTVKDGEVHIVEVKTRREPLAADPLVNMTRTKQNRIIKAAGAFMKAEAKAGLISGMDVYFDVITIVFNDKGHRVEYYPKAFIPIYV